MPELLRPQQKLRMKIQAVLQQGECQSRLGAAHGVNGGLKGKVDGRVANLLVFPGKLECWEGGG